MAQAGLSRRHRRCLPFSGGPDRALDMDKGSLSQTYQSDAQPSFQPGRIQCRPTFSSVMLQVEKLTHSL